MNIRKLKIQPDENFDNFRISLLKALNLFDYNKNCLLDFEDRIDNYFKKEIKHFKFKLKLMLLNYLTRFTITNSGI